MSLNKILLIGNLGKDPDYQQLQNSTVCKFSLATNRAVKNQDGSVTQQPVWHNIVCWNKVADRCKQYLHKGSKIYCEGEISYRQYQDQQGNNHNVTEIIMYSLEMLDSKPQTQQQPQQQYQQAPQQQQHYQQQPPQQPTRTYAKQAAPAQQVPPDDFPEEQRFGGNNLPWENGN
jgi:single-strand DNA-binding protein